MTANAHSKAYLYKRVVDAKLYIDAHFCEQIDLDSISNQAYFSKFHFLRLFKQAFGISPHAYLTSLRIQRAKELLSAGSSVKDTCHDVGFESMPSFVNLFRKSTGKTPTAYAKEQFKQAKEIEADPFSHVPGCFANSYGWRK